MKIGYFGNPGSYSYFAACQYFGGENEFASCARFVDVFESVKHGDVDAGVIPIENSLAGSVVENYDLLLNYDVHIIGEIYLKIDHCLLAYGDGGVERIKKIYAHPQALAQCSDFFIQHPEIEKVAYADNASAANYIAELKEAQVGAFASHDTARMYGLKIVAEQVADENDNYTRFLIISSQARPDADGDKCSILFSVAHNPGSLVSALQLLADYGLNLCKIESRPIKNKPFEYMFFVDLLLRGDQRMHLFSAIHYFSEHVSRLKVLGVYKTGIDAVSLSD